MANQQKARFETLADWLHWQEQLHPNAIDMGLDRVQRVLERMRLRPPPFRIVTVGGTNGKGSCVAMLEAMLRAQGYRTGAYTSPHLLQYNERVVVNGVEATDQEFCDAFARVDAARDDISLTYFEFGTLAALDIFRAHAIDIAVLEVGMGGRLDAVNAVDPEGALVASVGLDHQEWLGNDRDSIGYEKAGIYRADRPAICGDRNPPPRLIETARQIGAKLRVLGRDHDWVVSGSGWSWRSEGLCLENLPAPQLPGRIQFDNASSVIALLSALPSLGMGREAIEAGLTHASVPARFQRMAGNVELIFDVAHNPDAAAVLAANLAAYQAGGNTFAVLGMFRDKAAEEVALQLAPQFDRWFTGGLAGARGQTATALAARIHSVLPDARVDEHDSVVEAYHAACAQAKTGDRIVVCGSFQTVAAVLQQIGSKRATIN